jgi:hypothetical protein
LAVRERPGNSIHKYSDASEPELSTGPETADGDTLPDSIVIAVLDLHAGDPLKGFFDRGSGVSRA